MNTKAIERIKGYCCEVIQEQWEELVKVDGNVTDVHPPYRVSFFAYSENGTLHWSRTLEDTKSEPIPFPDFLAKLRGKEEWQPKAGEMVEVKIDGQWCIREYIGSKHDRHFVWSPPRSQYFVEPSLHIRPHRPTLTRAEAEAKLNARIID